MRVPRSVRETAVVTTMPAEVVADARAELIELIKMDYETTRSLIDGVVRTALALRGVGLTLVLAVLTVAVDASSVALTVCALAGVGLFLYLDAYHGWLYAEALKRAHELEHLLALRYKELERGGIDDDVTFDLDVALASHRFGQYSNFPRFRFRLLTRARPKAVYAILYGCLAALSVGAMVYSSLS